MARGPAMRRMQRRPRAARFCRRRRVVIELDGKLVENIFTAFRGIAQGKDEAYVDLDEGVTMREVIDDATGISSRVVVDWKQQPNNSIIQTQESNQARIN